MNTKFWLFSIIQIFSTFTTELSMSQPIIIDNSTPTILNQCNSSCIIQGGTIFGKNLFHSFTEFSVSKNKNVSFIDPGVNNIISRVTGSKSSIINGRLGVLKGSANLFLINPQGITFGPSSSLDLDGSFIATTANSVEFGNQGILDLNNSNIPVLAVNPTALLFSKKTGKIKSQSSLNSGVDLSQDQIFGLRVDDTKSLFFVGGEVVVDGNKSSEQLQSGPGGGVHALGGRIGLVSIDEGRINVSFDGSTPELILLDRNDYADVSIINGSQINTVGRSGGSIQIIARELEISNGSKIVAGIDKGTGSTLSVAGDIKINLTGDLNISFSQVINELDSNAQGQGGDIYVKARNISSESGEFITNTRGRGDAGNIDISADGKVALDSFSTISSAVRADEFSTPEIEGIGIGDGGNVALDAGEITLSNLSFIQTASFGLGSAGEILVNARGPISLSLDSRVGSVIVGKDELKDSSDPNVLRLLRDQSFLDSIDSGDVVLKGDSLSLSYGSQITSSTVGEGVTQGGNIIVETKNLIDISGYSSQSIFGFGTGFSSGIFSVAQELSTGSAGNIKISTSNLIISNGAAIDARTSNSSNGGSIFIKAINFSALDGGQVRSVSNSAGNAGRIKLDVINVIRLAGTDPDFGERLDILLNIGLLGFNELDPSVANRQIQVLRDIGPDSGLFANATSDASGKAGNISVDPKLVVIRDGATITVNNAGSGPGGDIFLQSGDLTLDRGTISATSNSNTGGNIELSIDDLLVLQNNSLISTTASSSGTAGNIDIRTGFIIADPTENSDIIANAFDGKGGQIVINADGILGLKIREKQTSFSDITAISQNNPQLNGNVIVNTPETNPIDNLTEQPAVIEPPQEIAKGCRPGQSLGGSTFTHVGRGGLPLSPQQTQTPTNVWQDLRSHSLQPTTISSTDPSPTSLIPTSSITEAKGWTKDTHGRIYLTANVPQPTQSPQPIATC